MLPVTLPTMLSVPAVVNVPAIVSVPLGSAAVRERLLPPDGENVPATLAQWSRPFWRLLFGRYQRECYPLLLGP